MKTHHRRLRCRGLDFHVAHWGEDAPAQLILLHGWGDCGATFAPLCAHWARRAPVAAPDMRGFGQSAHSGPHYWFADYIADLDAILDALSPTQPLALIGHSMGAQIASLYAGIRPERITHLVILDGLFLPDTPSDQAPKRYRSWLHQLQEPPQARVYPDFHSLATRIQKQHPSLNAPRALEVAKAWAGEVDSGVQLHMDPRHRMRGPLLFRATESKAIWQQITAATLFVDGDQSAFAQAIDHAERDARRACFQRRNEKRIEGAGHMLHFDAPEQTAASVDAWLVDQGWPSGGASDATTRPHAPT
ncbi:MAG: alpha/beta fold hydrolase [Algiphilus sp.]